MISLDSGAAAGTLLARLDQARAQTDRLFQMISPEALLERPIPERHRLIFYLGHVEAFDWNLVCRGALDLPPFHPAFDRLFAFGIDPEVGHSPGDKPSDWPAIGEVERYRLRVRESVDRGLRDVPEELAHVAIEHRLMHAETLAYLLHHLPHNQKTGDAGEPVERRPPAEEWIVIPPGMAALGRESGFGWDNEFEALSMDVPAFRICKYKVTNGDYLRFVQEGAPAPHYWRQIGGEWFYRGMFADVGLPLDWPVYVTRQQAAAYAAWRGKRLIEEAEYHRAAGGRQYPWGEAHPGPRHGNFNFERWDPIPVDASPAGDSPYGVSQLCGNGWEWTSTVFAPLPGFAARPYYPGYSADFFDGRHFVLKGGSQRTAACMLRSSFRNWFRPDYPYVYATFRLAESL